MILYTESMGVKNRQTDRKVQVEEETKIKQRQRQRRGQIDRQISIVCIIVIDLMLNRKAMSRPEP